MAAVNVLRWGARIVSALLGVLLGIVLVAEVVAGTGPPMQDVQTYILIALWIVMYAGIIIGFFSRWEGIGGALLIIGSVAMQVAVGALNSVYLLFGAVGVAFIVCWWLTQGAQWWRARQERDHYVA